MQMPAEIRSAIVNHARFAFPEEACGLLATDDRGRLRMAYCLTNSEHSTSSFTVDPAEHFGALHHAEANGWEIGGAFHSHPTSPPIPSATDIAGALDPRWLYVIAGPVGHDAVELRGYRITDGAAREVELAGAGS